MSLPPTFVKEFHDEESVRKMEYHQLGSTGLIVSRISIGGGTLAGTHYGPLELDVGVQTVRDALRRGINYIDTAPWYGQGKSEYLLGQALKGVPRESYYIATKIGRYEPDYKNQFNFSATKTTESVKKSLSLLDLDYVDIIQIHDIEFVPSIDILLNETLPTLEALKHEGYVRHIGLTGYPLNALKEVILAAPGQFEVVLTYTRYTLIDESLRDYMEFFKQQKLGVICASVHGLGLLTNAGPPNWHVAGENIRVVCRQAGDYCKEQNVELGKLALYHAVQYREPDTILVGMQTPQLLDINLDAYLNGLTSHEAEVLKVCKEKFFCRIQNLNWEGIEIKRYWDHMKTLKTE